MTTALVALQLKYPSSALLAFEFNDNLNIYAIDEYNRNALHYIALNNYIELYHYIKDNDELNEVEDVNGETPSDICIRLNHHELFELINRKKHLDISKQIMTLWD